MGVTGNGSELHARTSRRLVAILFTLLFVAGCSDSASRPVEAPLPPGRMQLTGAGAMFPSALYKVWFEAYHSENPSTFIKYSAVGSGEGVRRFVGKNLQENEQVDFGASDAAMQDAELAQMDNRALMIPMTGGCVVLAYNLPGFKGQVRLSRRAYTGIFLGEIKKWNDALIAQSNPGVSMPNLTIVTAVRQDPSGTTYAFTRNLDAVSETWRSHYGPATLVNWPGNAMRASGNEGVAALIEKSVGSIGYLGFEFARRINLPVASLENKEGTYIRPSSESCSVALSSAELPENLRLFISDPSGADSYPLVTFSWILVRKNYSNPQTAAAVRDLFRWCLLGGQGYAPGLDFVPLPKNVAEKSLAAINTISPGR